jgi:hypothetical protein
VATAGNASHSADADQMQGLEPFNHKTGETVHIASEQHRPARPAVRLTARTPAIAVGRPAH